MRAIYFCRNKSFSLTTPRQSPVMSRISLTAQMAVVINLTRKTNPFFSDIPYESPSLDRNPFRACPDRTG
jgi:hypothetical protein